MVWTAERMYAQARSLIPNEEGNIELGKFIKFRSSQMLAKMLGTTLDVYFSPNLGVLACSFSLFWLAVSIIVSSTT